MSIKITKHVFEYGSQKYFRGNAHLLELGSHGEKKDPIGPKAYVDPNGKIKASLLAGLPIKQSSVSIDWNSVKQADLEGDVSLKFFGLGRKHAIGFNYTDAKKADLKLVNFSIDETPLKKCLNDDADIVRKSLADEGADARVVSEVWVVVEAELAAFLDANFASSHQWSAFGNTLDLTVSGGSKSSETITISAGTTFAYKLHKVSKWSKGKEKIEDMEADYKGFA